MITDQQIIAIEREWGDYMTHVTERLCAAMPVGDRRARLESAVACWEELPVYRRESLPDITDARQELDALYVDIARDSLTRLSAAVAPRPIVRHVTNARFGTPGYTALCAREVVAAEDAISEAGWLLTAIISGDERPSGVRHVNADQLAEDLATARAGLAEARTAQRTLGISPRQDEVAPSAYTSHDRRVLALM